MSASSADTRGFVLPSILLTLVLLLGLVAWSTTSSRLELRTGTATANAMEAFNVAELGLVETIRTMESAGVEALPLWGDTVVSQTLPNGSWSVTVTRLPNQLAMLRATGLVGNGGSFASASREIGQIVRVKPANPVMAPLAALTTRGYVKVTGASSVSGIDPGVVRAGCSPVYPDVAGVMINDPTLVDTNGPNKVTGSPPVLEDNSLADPDAFNSVGGATWEEWIEAATHTLPGGTLSQVEPSYAGGDCNYADPNNWGEPNAFVPATDPCGDYFPIIYFTGSVQLTGGGRGQGVLIVDGDVTFTGGLDFQGVVIATGVYKATGNGNNVTGTIYAANADYEKAQGAGRSDTVYSKCVIDLINSQIDMVGGLVPLDRRSWADVSSVTGG